MLGKAIKCEVLPKEKNPFSHKNAGKPFKFINFSR